MARQVGSHRRYQVSYTDAEGEPARVSTTVGGGPLSLRLSRYLGMSEACWTGLPEDREIIKDQLDATLEAVHPIASDTASRAKRHQEPYRLHRRYGDTTPGGRRAPTRCCADRRRSRLTSSTRTTTLRPRWTVALGIGRRSRSVVSISPRLPKSLLDWVREQAAAQAQLANDLHPPVTRRPPCSRNDSPPTRSPPTG